MKTKPLTFLLVLTSLFLFFGSVFGQQTKLNIESHYKNGNEVGVAQINNDADAQEKSSLRLKNRKLPEELIKVKKYILENDYPEVFGEENYRVAVDGFEIADFENNNFH